MSLFTLRDLLVHDLRDLFSAETQIVSALPLMRDAASTDELRSLVAAYADVVRDHVLRLHAIFERLQALPEGKDCKSIHALLEADRTLMSLPAEPAVMDAALVGAISRMQHYKIAGYRIVETHAHSLEDPELEQALRRLRADEQQAERRLIATGLQINAEAPDAAGS